MKALFALAASVVVAASMACPAQAGPATVALGKCLTDSSTGRDRVAFIRFTFLALSTHPDVRAFTNVSDEQRSAFAKQAGDVFNRLVLHECRKEAIAAVRADGESAIQESFGTFGEVATSQLMADKVVDAAMGEIAKYTDDKGLGDLLAEAKAK